MRAGAARLKAAQVVTAKEEPVDDLFFLAELSEIPAARR